MAKVDKHPQGTPSHGKGAGNAKGDGHGKKSEHKLPDEKLYKWQHDFAAADQNQDGKLAKSELKMGAKGFDKDGDGKVTRDEYRAGFRDQNSFAALDANHDGSLDEGEAAKGHRFTDDSFDTDGDHQLTAAEYIAGRKAEWAELKEARRDDRFEHLSERQKRILKRYDTDFNGTISREEFGAGRDADNLKRMEAKMAENFEAAGAKDSVIANADQTIYKDYDQNHDNLVDVTEFNAGQLADRQKNRDNNLAGTPDANVNSRLKLDSLGLGLNRLASDKKASPAATGTSNAHGSEATPSDGKTDFTISTFNVLGSSHTAAGGKEPGMASGVQRMNGVVDILKKHDVDVVGFQEMQKDQAKAFNQKLGDKYALYPGTKGDSENSIAWRRDKFDLVKATTEKIPYFNGHIRKMPVVLLRDKETGKEVYFVNVHNPADTARFHHQQKYRTEAMQREVALVNKLKAKGYPVVVTGDMNEGNEYYNGMTHGAKGMHASASANGRPPKNPGIDWIFGSSDIAFDHYVRDHGQEVRHTTDHPVVISHATVK